VYFIQLSTIKSKAGTDAQIDAQMTCAGISGAQGF
jgi:hypothetical protein